ncbi:Uncharacterised protein [Segatella copri]|nr:Uncharacterised protein [Segatella copri]
MNRSLLLNNTSLRILSRWLSALRNHVHTFYDSTVLLNEDLKHLTSLALICTGNNDNGIVFLNM